MAIVKVDLISYKGIKIANSNRINFEKSKTTEVDLYKQEEFEG